MKLCPTKQKCVYTKCTQHSYDRVIGVKYGYQESPEQNKTETSVYKMYIMSNNSKIQI